MFRTAPPRFVWLGVVLLLASCGGGGDGGGTGPSLVNTLERLSGDKQVGTTGQALPAPLIVRVHDKAGDPVSGVGVAFAVAAGGGSVSSASVTTDADGKAAVTLTLGPAAGTDNNKVTATAQGLTGSPVTFTASAQAPSPVVVGAISPDTLTQGTPATITGSGFSATALNNQVTIGGIAATVTAASSTSLTVTVPTICRATQALPVVVTVGTTAAPAVNAPVKPAAYLTVPLGKQVILHTASNLCVQLAPSSSAEQYLVGVQSVSEVPTSLTPVVLTGDVAPGTPPSTLTSAIATLTAQRSAASGRGIDAERSPRARRWMAHRTAEARFQAKLARLYPSPAALRARRSASPSFSAGFMVPVDAAVGDTVPMKFPDITSNDPCTTSIPVKAVVRAIGTHGIWLEDVDNPSGYAGTDFDALSAQFDSPIYSVDVGTFGTPSDFDNNGKIAVLVTKELNRANENLLGFVISTDLFPPSTCSSSNDGEIFYAKAPDPTNDEGGGAYSVANARADAPFLIAHEFTHIIQMSRRILANANSFQSIWETEGQATLAEEVVGNAVEARTTGQDLGLAVAFNLDDPTSIDWYSDRFGDMAQYFGFVDPTSTTTGAPEQCGWQALPPDAGPCAGGRQVYGVPWSLLRWASEQYASKFGGEAGFQKALIDQDGAGLDHLADVVGVPVDSLLAPWAAALYLDNRYTGLDPRLTFSSWNLHDIYEGNYMGQALFPTTHLTPRVHPFGAFTDAMSIRAGSSSYALIGGSAHTAAAIGVGTAGGGSPASTTRLWIVRVQ